MLTELSEEQKRLWNQYQQNWFSYALQTKTEPDREAVGRALANLYAELSLDPPPVIWCDSPWQLVALPPIAQQLMRMRLRRRLQHWSRANAHGSEWSSLWKSLKRELPAFESIRRNKYKHRNVLWSQFGHIVPEGKIRDVAQRTWNTTAISKLVSMDLLRSLRAGTHKLVSRPMQRGVRIPLRRALELRV